MDYCGGIPGTLCSRGCESSNYVSEIPSGRHVGRVNAPSKLPVLFNHSHKLGERIGYTQVQLSMDGYPLNLLNATDDTKPKMVVGCSYQVDC